MAVVDSRMVSPPDEALRLGLEFVAEIDRCTVRCAGDWAVLLFAVTATPILCCKPRKDSELPDLEPSLSGCNVTRDISHRTQFRERRFIILHLRRCSSFRAKGTLRICRRTSLDLNSLQFPLD